MSRKTFHQSFTIHPVGQGFFYSCTIKNQERIVFRMVFDCGSKTAGAGQEEVEIYRSDNDFVSEKILDLLVISHFDGDHVNHIGKLLDGGVKIKRLVMPFVCFEERLYLTLKFLNENQGYNDAIDYTIRLILDPLTTLANNLDDNFEGYLIENDPDNPVLPDDINNNNESNEDNEKRLLFNFPRKDRMDQNAKGGFKIPEEIKDKVFEVKDSTKGNVTTASGILLLMDFLFYKKSIGEKENEFYKNVKELFIKFLQIDANLEEEKVVDAVLEKIKTISSSTQIVKIFKDAAKEAGIPQTNVSNLNTTALCMLHRNLEGIYDYIIEGRHKSNEYYSPDTEAVFYYIQKFLADISSRILKEDFRYYDYDDFHYRRCTFFGYNSQSFPNTLLTSDSFLLEEKDVKAFMKKYKIYFDNFWLFQIPHHGSKENSNGVLHANIPFNSSCFINYGTKNNHKHPSDTVIHSLVTNGLSTKLIPVNEYQGYQFQLVIERRERN